MKKQVLDGVKVVDFTWHLTGPLTTKVLADLGAEVIKIETRSRLDPGRVIAPRAGSFNQFNTGKLGITLNLSSPEGLELAKRLVARADIVVENFAGGAIKRMGLGYDELKKVKPDIIMLSTCTQGQTGPHATHPGSGHKLTALSGFSQITGWPDRQPGWIEAYTDFIGPHYNAIAILAALDYRRRTGKGQYLDMSQYEDAAQFIAPLILDCAVNRRVAERMGNKCDYAAPHNAYRCRGEDRWCAIAVFTDEEWRSFCKVIGSPALVTDPRFSTLPARKENEEELDRLVNEWTTGHTAEEVMTLMQRAGVAAGVAETAEDQLDYDPQLRHRRTFRTLRCPEIKQYRTPGPHFLLSKVSYRLKRAPLLGEHNEYVFKGILGLSDKEYSRLVDEGVIS
ncbi:CaiB/BaiF CoA transferase family protein [Chloroflexota bacterium]